MAAYASRVRMRSRSRWRPFQASITSTGYGPGFASRCPTARLASNRVALKSIT
jgi:hypothetical protein